MNVSRLCASLFVLVTTATALGCGGSTPDPKAPAAKTEVFPAPFTAAQIKAATKVGRMFRFRVEAKGEDTALRSLEFTAVADDGADILEKHTTLTGAQLSSPKKSHAPWRALQAHGEFPRSLTTRSEEEVDLGTLGKVAAIKYVVQGEPSEREVFYFDPARPGAPVLFFHEENAQRVRVTTLVEYKE